MSNIVSGVTLLSICSQQWSLCETSPCGSGKALPWEAPAETLAQPPPGTCSSTANPMLLPDREPNSAQHPLMDDPGGLISPSACEPANAASFSSYCARSLHQPVWSCFLLLPPKNHWHPAQPVSPYWTNNGADPADTQPHGTSKNGQKWPFVCMQNIPPLPPASASGCLSPSAGLYALLWNTTDQHGEEQLKVHSAELAFMSVQQKHVQGNWTALGCLYTQGGEDATYMNIYLLLLLPSPPHFLFLPLPSCYKAAR